MAALPAPAAERGPAAEQADELAEIVVTARRRTESLQDTPVAVTVVTADILERMQIPNTTDLGSIAPNLQFHTYGTLFGRNTIGGAVLLTTNGPGEGAGNVVRASVGEDNLFDAFAVIDPFDTGAWPMRTSAGLRKRDGLEEADGIDDWRSRRVTVVLTP
jgi:outer membrane receptor protein involved in Fe transport